MNLRDLPILIVESEVGLGPRLQDALESEGAETILADVPTDLTLRIGRGCANPVRRRDPADGTSTDAGSPMKKGPPWRAAPR